MDELIIKKKKVYIKEVKEKATFNEYVGFQLRKARKEKNITQEEFSNMVGMSRPSIVNLEKGKQRLSIQNLYKFCVTLNIKPEVLLPFENDSANNSKS